MNNMTVDGSYFNNSFGLAGQARRPDGRRPHLARGHRAVPGERWAPYDVRQGNFVGAGVNTVTRSEDNRFVGSVYRRFRNQSMGVGMAAKGQPFNPGTFNTTNTGEWVGGPVVQNRLFFFESFEKQMDTRPLSTYQSQTRAARRRRATRRACWRRNLDTLSAFLPSRSTTTRRVRTRTSPKKTPAKPFLVKADFNLNPSNKVTFRYNQLLSSTDVNSCRARADSDSGGRRTARTS